MPIQETRPSLKCFLRFRQVERIPVGVGIASNTINRRVGGGCQLGLRAPGKHRGKGEPLRQLSSRHQWHLAPENSIGWRRKV